LFVLSKRRESDSIAPCFCCVVITWPDTRWLWAPHCARPRFEHNLYFAAPGHGWFKWGTTWSRHQSYPNSKEFQADLGIDTNSQVFEPGFADILQLDFRMGEETLSLLEESYPGGPVPGVALGVWR